MERMLELLSSAVDEASEKSDRPWEAGAAAARWLEHEIGPLLATYKAKTRGELPHRCPECVYGEAYASDALTLHVDQGNTVPRHEHGPLRVVRYTCGHRVQLRLLRAELILSFRRDDRVARVNRSFATVARIYFNNGGSADDDANNVLFGECCLPDEGTCEASTVPPTEPRDPLEARTVEILSENDSLIQFPMNVVLDPGYRILVAIDNNVGWAISVRNGHY